ncbi:Retrovirus-related Pol polyprotein from transposon TNT 1-94 [Dendrobium catenatum]|uniref:Retrovirus-related Pol polyprotein from transposon TNT 1-94 n=1 Tax=Dendrobium catenatum TaxID=906689 RepID=A0A2I0W9Y3_9ASPA|nr:Retrovirus-related Pol polyprotein from transposon TNT 1-94 [Dendrobium catenatum]
MKEIPYANVVGYLMYGMVATRPNLAYAISLMSRFMSNPNKNHWNALKWLMRYVKGSHDTGIMYAERHEGTKILTGYTDSDFAVCLDTR